VTHLEPKQHYIDQYDKLTVERCRRLERTHKETSKEEIKIPKGEKISKKEAERAHVMAHNLMMYFETGEAYVRKEPTIQKWMDRDRERDELLESAQAPEGIECLTCGSVMEVTYKHLHDWEEGKPDRVLFMYDCPQGHLPRRTFFSDGEEWKHKRAVCPKCESELTREEKKKGDIITTTESCPSCDYINTTELDFSPKKEKVDKNFVKDRERFCLSEKEGQKYIEAKGQLESIGQFMDELKEKEKHKKDYDEVDKLKKLTVIELEKLLAPVFEKQGYTKLNFGDPDMGKDLFLPFTVYDTKSDRKDRDSSFTLQKIAKEALKGTNWRLMSDGISYRSGILTGRFRAYEREEDLLKLVRRGKVK